VWVVESFVWFADDGGGWFGYDGWGWFEHGERAGGVGVVGEGGLFEFVDWSVGGWVHHGGDGF
jgi:hypothetical protein